jgi:hypothetical protein
MSKFQKFVQILGFLLIILIISFPIQSQTEKNYEIASDSSKIVEIVVNQNDKSLEITFTCVGCEINFKFMDNENYLKYNAQEDFDSRLTLNEWDSYSNKIFISNIGSWWIIFENEDSFNKTVNLSYQLVDPPVTEDWIFWILTIPWIGGFFIVVTYWFYKKRKR